jgi:hypothetical protein
MKGKVFADGIGDALTWKILTDDTKEIIYRSAVRSAVTTSPNLKIDQTNSMEEGTKSKNNTIFVRSKFDEPTHPMHTIDIEALIGRIYKVVDDNGEQHNVTVIKKIINTDDDGHNNDTRFLVKHDNTSHTEEIVSYNHILDHIQQHSEENPNDQLYIFNCIIAHHGPIRKDDVHYKGC